MRNQLESLQSCREEYGKAKEQYEKVLDSAPDAMIFVNRDSRIIYVNAQVEVAFGYSQDEVEGKDLEMLIPERYRGRHGDAVKGYFEFPRLRNMGSGLEIYARRKDGTEFPADISLSPLETDEGMLAVAAIRDITERKKVAEELEKNYHIQKVITSVLEISLIPVSLEELLENILDLTLSIPHLTLGGRGAIFLANNEKEELVVAAQRGFSEADPFTCDRVPYGNCLCGEAISRGKIIHSEHVDERHTIIKEGPFSHGHYCVPISVDGERLGLLNVFIKQGHKSDPAETEFLTAVAKTLAGVIKHKQAEEEKERLTVELGQAEKFAALGRITANVAHEIRNPLTALGGFARRLHSKLSSGTREREYADLIVDEVGQLEGILKKVLTFSKSETDQTEQVDMSTIIEQTLKIYHDLFRERGVEVTTVFDGARPVLASAQQVREVFENLFSNALDAMEKGGTLTVEVGEEFIEENSYVVVTVKDTGKGIPEDKLGSIFEPFVTTKISERGTGLGLAIVKKIVEEHNGFIKVESVQGTGTTFRLFFPVERKVTAEN